MKKLPVLFVTLFLLLSLAACQTTPSAAPGGPSDSPPTTSLTAPSRQYLSLGSVAFSQSGKAPDYTIKVNMPVMNGSTNPHVVAFNKAVSDAAQKEIETFKNSLKDMPATPIVAGSSFELKYMPVFQNEHIVSLQLKIDQYMDGAAHPFSYSVAINYDISKGQAISLDQLFAPDANYLQIISDYCKAQLAKRDIAFDSQQHGADATAENYRNWNISTEGLVITFDPYQVAAYAAGPQMVIIPYATFKDIIDPGGPLAEFKQEEKDTSIASNSA